MLGIQKIYSAQFPPLLREINDPPEQLYIKGTLPEKDAVLLCVVGSRKYSTYGKDACEKLIDGLRGYNVIIVSGLALGIDGIAHRAAMKAGLKTIAVPGSGLEDSVIYPATHFGLANEIIEKGGALISEFEPNFRATTWSFPRRNRLMAGMSHATLIVEAGEKSGTLITARLSLDYNRDVFVIPHSIFSENGIGSNYLMRQGAMPITKSEDILTQLGFNIDTLSTFGGSTSESYGNCSDEELKILELLKEPAQRDSIISELKMDISKANQLLTIMEIKKLIKEEFGEISRM